MELSLVLTALRRKRWLIILCALVGLVPGVLVLNSNFRDFESSGALGVSPPTSEASRWSNQPDRYVLGQIGVLRSSQMAEAVAKKLGEPETAGSVASVTNFGQRAETDIVDVTARTRDAGRSQRIVQAYLDSYLEVSRAAQAAIAKPAIDALDLRLTDLSAQIAKLNETLTTAIAPYVAQVKAGTLGQVPDPLTIDPATTTARNQATAEYDRLLAVKNDLQFSSPDEVTSVIVSDASVAQRVALTRDGLIIIGGGAVGALLGVAAALLLAQLAGDTLDDATVSRVLGVAVAAHVPPDRALRPGPLAALEALPPDLATTVDKLCARADSMALSDEPLTVAVVGSQPRAGTTTLALAMARRFADFGFSVLVVDGDARRPYLTDLLAGGSDIGLSDLVNTGFDLDVDAESLTPTFDNRIRVLGQGVVSDRPRLQRQSVTPVLEFGRSRAQVVIVDAGSALGSSFAIQTCRAADAVVLAVPLDRQRTSSLREISRQLESELGKLIPVLTSPGRRGQGSGRDGAVATTGREKASAELLDEVDPDAFDDDAASKPTSKGPVRGDVAKAEEPGDEADTDDEADTGDEVVERAPVGAASRPAGTAAKASAKPAGGSPNPANRRPTDNRNQRNQRNQRPSKR